VWVHGGLTFANKCQPHAEGEEVNAICHVVEPGEDDDVWWLGFDCAHIGFDGDFAPAFSARHKKLYEETGDPLWLDSPFDDGTYKDQAYVTDEVRSLAKQLAEL